MWFIKKIIKVLFVIFVAILILIALTFLTSRGFASIADLINKDTELFYEEYNLDDPELSKYKINGVLLIPYAKQNPPGSYEQEYYTYFLRLAAYKQKENNCKVIVNKVSLEGIGDIRFDGINKELNEILQFTDDEELENMQESMLPMIDAINNYDMGLTEKSQIKVVLNVSVEENGEVTTRDVEYIFETRIRTYLIQR